MSKDHKSSCSFISSSWRSARAELVNNWLGCWCNCEDRGGVIDWWWSVITIQQWSSVTPWNKARSLPTDNKVEGRSLNQRFSPEGFLSKLPPNTNLPKNWWPCFWKISKFSPSALPASVHPRRHFQSFLTRKEAEGNKQSKPWQVVRHPALGLVWPCQF